MIISSHTPKTQKQADTPLAESPRAHPFFCGGCMAAFLFLASRPLQAQQALMTSVNGEAATQTLRSQAENQPYTFKSGDFRLLLAPGFAVDWNDNVNLTKDHAQADEILFPSLAITASYPVTDRNLLLVNLTVGYDDYINNRYLSRFYLASGSQLSFDVYTGDFKINFHDRLDYTQDSATQAQVSNTGAYGTFDNSIGLLTTWNLQDVNLSLGYDHQTTLTTSGQLDYTDNSTESILARAGLKVHPQLTVGFEGTVAYTAYDQKVLNNLIAYSGGVYADYQPGHYFHFQPRFGYSLYHAEQTSLTIPAQDQSSLYFDLTIMHDVTKFVSYSVSAGHEIVPGLQAETTQDWYLRPKITLNLIKNVGISTSFFYEHGNLGGGLVPGTSEEVFDWYGGNVGLSYSLMKNLDTSLNYRFTMRSSNVSTGEYTQNDVGVSVTYTFK